MRYNTNFVFQEYERGLVKNLFETYGIEDSENDSHLDKYARNIAISLACSSGLEACRNATKTKLHAIMDGNVDFHQNVRDNMYCAALREATRADYRNVYQRLADSDDATYRSMLIRSLGCIETKDILNNYLQTALNSTTDAVVIYRSGEQERVLSAVYQNSQNGLESGIIFLQSNIDEAARSYGNKSIENMIKDIAGRVNNDKVSDEVSTIYIWAIGDVKNIT